MILAPSQLRARRRRLVGQLEDVALKLRSPYLRPSGHVVLMSRADRLLDELLLLEPRLKMRGK